MVLLTIRTEFRSSSVNRQGSSPSRPFPRSLLRRWMRSFGIKFWRSCQNATGTRRVTCLLFWLGRECSKRRITSRSHCENLTSYNEALEDRRNRRIWVCGLGKVRGRGILTSGSDSLDDTEMQLVQAHSVCLSDHTVV